MWGGGGGGGRKRGRSSLNSAIKWWVTTSLHPSTLETLTLTLGLSTGLVGRSDWRALDYRAPASGSVQRFSTIFLVRKKRRGGGRRCSPRRGPREYVGRKGGSKPGLVRTEEVGRSLPGYTTGKRWLSCSVFFRGGEGRVKIRGLGLAGFKTASSSEFKEPLGRILGHKGEPKKWAWRRTAPSQKSNEGRNSVIPLEGRRRVSEGGQVPFSKGGGKPYRVHVE